MTIFGHQEQWDSLSTYLPRVSLFVGPYSVGKRTVAEHLADHYGIDDRDVLRVEHLDSAMTSSCWAFSETPPVASPFKIIIVELRGAKMAAVNSIAAAVARAKPKTRFIFISTENFSWYERIADHAVVVRFGYLVRSEVINVLSERMGMSRERAITTAQSSVGQILPTVRRLPAREDGLAKAQKAALAIRQHEADTLQELAKEWTDEATDALTDWAYESLAQEPSLFALEDLTNDPGTAVRTLVALRPRVRPRLVVRSQLASVLRGE